MFQQQSDDLQIRLTTRSRRPAGFRRKHYSQLRLEDLEERRLLSVAPVGGEFQVNTFTTGNQDNPKVATDAAGDYVVVWQSQGQDGSSYGVYAQRYNAGGVAQGGEFPVNTYTTGRQWEPVVAMDAAGDFVVAWSSYGQDGSGYGVYARRYNAGGVAQSVSEFQVNTYTTNNQRVPSIAMDAAGDFVVAWRGYGSQDASAYGAYARRYNASGVAQGDQFLVNTYTTGFQGDPVVAMDVAGDFVISWWSDGQDGSDTGVYAQRYNAAGATQCGEFRVNTYTTDLQQNQSVAMDSTGGFVIAWDSRGENGGNWGVYAQRYSSVGAALGGEFLVETFTAGPQRVPSVGMDPAGNFIITWQSQEDGDGYGIYAQRYNASGVTQGSEFRVNTYTTNNQVNPSVAMDGAGDFVVAWNSNGEDGSGYGVYAQRYQATRGEFQVNTFIIADQRIPKVATDAAGDYVVVWTSQGQDGSGFGVYAQRYNSAGVAQASEFRVNTYTTGNQEAPSVAMDAAGDFVVAWESLGQDGSSFGVYAQRYNAAGATQGNEFRVNTYTTDQQEAPSAAMDAAGDFVVAWQSYRQDGSGYGVYAQRYNAAGAAQGSEFQVNTYTTNHQYAPSVAMDSAGDFVVAWGSIGQDGSGFGVYAQRYNAEGVAQASEFRVNAYTTNDQFNPSVAMDSAGGFVVAWTGYGQDGDGDGVYAQRYSASGVAQASEFQVNTFTTNHQYNPSVAMDSAGDFVVAWTSLGQDGSGYGVYAQRYHASGVAQGSEFKVNTYTTSNQLSPSVAMDAAGDFVVAWESYGQDGSGWGIYAQRYSVTAPDPFVVSINRASPAGPATNATTVSYTVTFNEPVTGVDPTDFALALTGGTTATTPVVVSGSGAVYTVTVSGISGGGTLGLNLVDDGTIRDSLGNPLVQANGVASFAPQVVYGVGSAPESVAAGDFTGDGKPDLVVANTASNSYSVLLNNGNGTFAVQPQVSAGSEPDSVAVADLNGDGNPDLVVATGGDNAVETYLGHGYGVFSQQSTTSAGNTPISVAVADVNGDGKPDVIVDDLFNNLTVFPGIGDGTIDFNSQKTYSAGANPIFVTTADFNGDGKVDLAAANYNGSSVSVLLNNGDGTFAAQTSYPVGVRPDSIAVGDFNHDGKSDMVVANGQGSSVSVLLNNGNGTFGTPVTYATDSTPESVTVADVNGDGIPDLIVANTSGNDMSVLLGYGNGAFGPQTTFAVGNGPDSVTTADFNGDGRPDVVVTNTYDNTVGVLLNTTNGNFTGQVYTIQVSVAPAGPEFRVNTYTTANQDFPSVATDAAGDYVVAWQSNGQDGSGWGVYAQRYNAAGVAQGSEFRVNTYTTNDQLAPSVAMDSEGDFVVAWQSVQDGSGYGIYAQRYNAVGVTQGSEFQVNTYTTNYQTDPSVAMDSAGDFVVAWESNLQDVSGWGIYAQRYNAVGATQGSEFQVNTYTTGNQLAPSVAMDSAGDFVVAWTSYGQDGSLYGVYAQRYNTVGAAQGSEFRVNTYTTDNQVAPSVAMDSAGDFVVAWQSYGQDGSSYGVYAQRYNAAGAAQGSEFRVNTHTGNPQTAPSVAMDSAGDFVVAWQSNLQDGSSYGVYAQRYKAAGAAQGSEFRVNTYTTNNQESPSVAMDSAGDFVVAWQSYGQDGNFYGVYAQRYAVTPSSVVGRDLFYANSSRYDLPGGSNPQTPNPFSDDNAIASDKLAYLPGSGAATFANVSSYASGINGIMVDLDNTGSHTSITLANILNDFTFKVGNNNSPGSWVAAPLPTAVMVRTGAGVAGSDRVELIWANGAITQKWLEVIVKATADTGLAANDVFFFGSEIGDTGSSNTATIFKVGANDTTGTQTHLATLGTNQPITNIYDFNRDGSVGAFDITVDQTHPTTNATGLQVINIGAGGPFAPPPTATSAVSVAPPATGNASVASALVSSSQSPAPPAIPPWIANRLAHVDLNSNPLYTYFQHLAQENTPKAKKILIEADQLAETLGLEDELLDDLLAGLTS